jgi:L-lactate dehydrogenase complex protein LldG
LLPVDRLLADLSELQALLQEHPPASSYVFISGPSKTGDIESHIVYGAHGPKDMHVVVLASRKSV